MCAKVCYSRPTHQDHLRKEHNIIDPELLKEKLESTRISRNYQDRFWCGFCVKLVDLEKKDIDTRTERFDHIDDHFMGRHGLAQQDIEEWIPVEGKDDEEIEGSADARSRLASK